LRNSNPTYIILFGHSEENSAFGRHRSKWEDNIKIDLKEIRWEGVEWLLVGFSSGIF
jgi:hypothetical protein